MENEEVKTRSLSDLRSNLETGVYSLPQTFKEDQGLPSLSRVDSSIKKTVGDSPNGEKPNNDFFLRQNSFSSSNKNVAGNRLA